MLLSIRPITFEEVEREIKQINKTTFIYTDRDISNILLLRLCSQISETLMCEDHTEIQDNRILRFHSNESNLLIEYENILEFWLNKIPDISYITIKRDNYLELSLKYNSFFSKSNQDSMHERNKIEEELYKKLRDDGHICICICESYPIQVHWCGQIVCTKI